MSIPISSRGIEEIKEAMPSPPLQLNGKPASRVAYVMSRFPKITETFILYEMLTLEQQGFSVELYPLQRENGTVTHPEARSFVERAHFQPYISWPIIRANLHFMLRMPKVYFGAMWSLLRGTWGSFRFFAGALAFFPKSVLFARHMTDAGIVHIHAHFASHPTAAAFIIHRLVGIPYSFTAHGSDIHLDKTMLSEKVTEAAFVVPISSFNKDVILKACQGQYADKMHVIHCGVDVQVFEQTAKDENRSLNSSFTVLCVGTLHEVKGQTHLIEACRLLYERGIVADCHFVGDGPDLTMLQQKAKEAELTDHVRFHGRKTRPEVVELIHAADVLVAPSVPSRDGRREGIPVVLMEAMAAGLPVVASRLSGIPELVVDGQTGFLTPPGDTGALAEALERLYRDPDLRQQLGQAGKDKVWREFDLYENVAILARQFNMEALAEA